MGAVGWCWTALPIELVEPTPFQRNLSDTHVQKLELVIGKIGRFLRADVSWSLPRGGRGGKGVREILDPQWQPSALGDEDAGGKEHLAIVVPEAAAAYQILAMNTEKAHNLREKSIEVIRMY